MNKLSIFSIVAIAISAFLFTFSQGGSKSLLSGKEKNYPTLEPGDKIDDMVIRTGSKKAAPLWEFCSSTKENDYTMRVDCGELSYTNLAIGYPFGMMELTRQCINWGAFNWEMSVDGHPIDLKAFGVNDLVHIFHPSHSGREVFRVSSVWDVVLVNPTPGLHQLQGQAQSPDGAEPYTWVVNFTVANPSN